MGLMDTLKVLEEKISGVLGDSGGRPEQSSGPEEAVHLLPPLEIRKAVLRRVEDALVRIDGELRFPFNRIDLALLASSEDVRAHLYLELEEQGRLEKELERMLRLRRVMHDPLALHFHTITPDYVTPGNEGSVRYPGLREDGYSLSWSREDTTEKIQGRTATHPTLMVETGTATPQTARLTGSRVNIGRLQEVVDGMGRIIRRNDLAFADEPGVNSTVSRLHAHLEPLSGEAGYRIVDDRSTEGTWIFRDGRRLTVPGGPRRGVVLQDGDEIYLGQARLRYTLRG